MPLGTEGKINTPDEFVVTGEITPAMDTVTPCAGWPREVRIVPVIEAYGVPMNSSTTTSAPLTVTDRETGLKLYPGAVGVIIYVPAVTPPKL